MSTRMSNAAIAKAFALISAAVALDQVTKIWAENRLPGRPIVVIEGAFSLAYVRNYAAAFGLGSFIDSASVRLAILLAITIGLTTVLLVGMIRSPDFASRLGYGITVAGALGNIIDRVRLGYVIDFLYWYGGFNWPAFNVADICVCVGIGILVVFGGKTPKKDEVAIAPSEPNQQASAANGS